MYTYQYMCIPTGTCVYLSVYVYTYRNAAYTFVQDAIKDFKEAGQYTCIYVIHILDTQGSLYTETIAK